MIDDNDIRSILLKIWDPFCIGENPNLSDDYDQFIAPIRALLEKKADVETLETHLEAVEQELCAPIAIEDRHAAAMAFRKLVE